MHFTEYRLNRDMIVHLCRGRSSNKDHIYNTGYKEEEALDITMKTIVKSGRQLEYY